jgi:DNA-binding MarR family transcriptional regulator
VHVDLIFLFRFHSGSGSLWAKAITGDYPPEYDAWERGALSLLHRETAGDIVAVLCNRGSARPQTIVESLDIARSTLEWHADHLIEQNVVVKERDERNHVTLALVRPTETAELVEEVTPSTPARMVDRFTRLTDRLLDGPTADE